MHKILVFVAPENLMIKSWVWAKKEPELLWKLYYAVNWIVNELSVKLCMKLCLNFAAAAAAADFGNFSK